MDVFYKTGARDDEEFCELVERDRVEEEGEVEGDDGGVGY